MGKEQEPKAKPESGLRGWVRGALSRLDRTLSSVEQDLRGAPGNRPATPARSGRAPGTGSLTNGPGTRQLNRGAGTGNLSRGRGTDALSLSKPAPSAPQPLTPPSLEALGAASDKRMAFIVDYMRDPTANPAFQDKALVYKILSEERVYQQHLVASLRDELGRLGLAPREKAALEARLQAATTRQGQLFKLQKQLTGVRGKTGGTGFFASPKDSPGDRPPS